MGVTTSPALPSQPPPPTVEYVLLIEPLFKVRGLWPKPSFPIQNEPFALGLRLTNKSEQPFPGCTLRDVSFRDTGEGGVGTTSHNEYTIQMLKPDQSTDIWTGNWTERTEGQVWLGCYLRPATPNTVIKTLSRDPSTGDIGRWPVDNGWSYVWFIQRKMDVQQARTNNLIMLLTLLLVLDSVFGLKNMAVLLLHLVVGAFAKIGHLFGG